MPQIALDIPYDHPAFAGHFPGRPIVPGVVLLDSAQRLIEAAYSLTLNGIAVAKFHSPAMPGDNLLLDYEMNGSAVRFEIRCNARKIADGTFRVDNGTVRVDNETVRSDIGTVPVDTAVSRLNKALA